MSTSINSDQSTQKILDSIVNNFCVDILSVYNKRMRAPSSIKSAQSSKMSKNYNNNGNANTNNNSSKNNTDNNNNDLRNHKYWLRSKENKANNDNNKKSENDPESDNNNNNNCNYNDNNKDNNKDNNNNKDKDNNTSNLDRNDIRNDDDDPPRLDRFPKVSCMGYPTIKNGGLLFFAFRNDETHKWWKCNGRKDDSNHFILGGWKVLPGNLTVDREMYVCLFYIDIYIFININLLYPFNYL